MLTEYVDLYLHVHMYTFHSLLLLLLLLLTLPLCKCMFAIVSCHFSLSLFDCATTGQLQLCS
jgi:hypothetical protein